MPEFIADGVKQLFGSSSPETVELLIGVDGDTDRVKADIQEFGGEIKAEVGRTTLRANVPVSEIEALCEVKSVISVELNRKDVYTQEGNLHPDQTSMT